MSLYLLTAAPIAYVVLLVTADIEPDRYPSMLRPLLRGVLVWIIGYIVYLFLAPLVQLRYVSGALYWYYAFHGFFYWCIVAVVGYVVFGLLRRDESLDSDFLEFGAFILGVLLLQPVAELITYHKSLNVYYLFLLPSLRILLVFGFASLGFISLRAGRILHYAVISAIIAIGVLFGFVGLLYTSGRPSYAYLLTTLFGLLVAGGYLYALHDYGRI